MAIIYRNNNLARPLNTDLTYKHERFRSLMKRYGRWVWYWSYRLTWGDDVRSRDLTQDTWLLVWDNLYRLRTDASGAELRA